MFYFKNYLGIVFDLMIFIEERKGFYMYLVTWYRFKKLVYFLIIKIDLTTQFQYPI